MKSWRIFFFIDVTWNVTYLKLRKRLAISVLEHLMELRDLVAVLVGQCWDAPFL